MMGMSGMRLVVVTGLLVAGAGTLRSEPSVGRGLDPDRPRPTANAPDLAVMDIYLTDACQVMVKLRNGGPVPLPDTAFSLNPPIHSSLQMSMDGQPWGSVALGAFDTAKQLKTPGGTLTKVWFPSAGNSKLPAGSHTLNLVLSNRAFKESNSINNSRSVTLSCSQANHTRSRGQSMNKQELIDSVAK